MEEWSYTSTHPLGHTKACNGDTTKCLVVVNGFFNTRRMTRYKRQWCDCRYDRDLYLPFVCSCEQDKELCDSMNSAKFLEWVCFSSEVNAAKILACILETTIYCLPTTTYLWFCGLSFLVLPLQYFLMLEVDGFPVNPLPLDDSSCTLC